MSASEKEQKKFILPKKVLIVVGVLLALALIGVSIYFFLEYRKNQDLLKNPTLAAQVEAQTLVASVGKLMELPQGEQPTIATVSDVNKLKDQPFFAKAKNGFKVLIYTKAQKAILYDPQADKIIEVTTLNLAEPSVAAATPTPIQIVLYNGTTTTGLTTTIEKQLKEKSANITVIAKANASKTTYKKTLVIDLTGKKKQAATELAKLLGGEVSSLPEGETKPTVADILVILGK